MKLGLQRHPGQYLRPTFCHLILIQSCLSLSFDYAINDEVETIESKRQNVGGYDRRSAHMFLGKSAQASSELETVKFIQPDNNDAETDYSDISIVERKMTGGRGGLEYSFWKKRKEAKANDISYTGPRLENGKVTLKFMKDLIDFSRNKNHNDPPVHPEDASTILRDIKEYYESLPSLIEIQVPDGENITVVGDIHAHIDMLIHIFKLSGLPSETNRYLFNGDFVDNGHHSAECALVLFGFKLLYPQTFFINRGNHEDHYINRVGGFEHECLDLYSQEMFQEFSGVFQWIPLAHLINNKVLVIHGGLFDKRGVTLDDIKRIERGHDPEQKLYPMMFNILWSDPGKNKGRRNNLQRGGGVMFGSDVTESFCTRNNIDYIIRSHEMKFEGYDVQHNDRMVTIFSVANYFLGPGSLPNTGAIMKLQAPELKQRFINFTIKEVTKTWSDFVLQGF